MTEQETQVVEAVQPTPPTVSKAKLEDFFHPNVIELIRVAPQSPIVRGFIMSKVGLLPPDELATFEQIKDWIEAMEKPKVLTRTPAARPVPRREFTAEFDHSRTVWGTCNYRMSETGSSEVGVDLDELREWIEDGETVDEILRNMREKAQEDGPGDWCGGDDTSCDNFESKDVRDDQSNLSSSREQFTRRLRQYLQDYDPELLEALANNG